MGKNVRAKKRANAAQLEIVDAAAHHAATSHITDKSNEELFVLDTTATPVPKELQPKSKQQPKHQVTAQKVQALLDKHDPATLQDMANPQKKRKPVAFDLWNEEEEQEPKQVPQKLIAGVAPPHICTKAQRASRSKAASVAPSVAVDVAQSGQSYHPDPYHHQNVIGEALALELRRNEAIQQRDAPLATGLSDETKAILLGDDDDDDNDESSSGEDETCDATLIFAKQKKKLTRAQRNRQKRIRAQQVQEMQSRQAKKRMNAIGEVKRLNRELEARDQERREQRAQLQLLRRERRVLGKSVVQHISQTHPITAPTLPVALTEEISGALRTMKPKGSLLTDRMESFQDRKMAESKHTKKTVVQGNKRRKVKIRGSAEREGHDYLLMG